MSKPVALTLLTAVVNQSRETPFSAGLPGSPGRLKLPPALAGFQLCTLVNKTGAALKLSPLTLGKLTDCQLGAAKPAKPPKVVARWLAIVSTLPTLTITPLPGVYTAEALLPLNRLATSFGKRWLPGNAASQCTVIAGPPPLQNCAIQPRGFTCNISKPEALTLAMRTDFGWLSLLLGCTITIGVALNGCGNSTRIA